MTKKAYKTSYVRQDGSMFLDCIWADTVESAKRLLAVTVDSCPVLIGCMFDDSGKTIVSFTK